MVRIGTISVAGQAEHHPRVIACAEYLVKEKYTSPAFLAGEGGSTVASPWAALTRRPELFATMLDDAGDSDALRIENSPGGPANIPEFEPVKTEDGFKGPCILDDYTRMRGEPRIRR